MSDGELACVELAVNTSKYLWTSVVVALLLLLLLLPCKVHWRCGCVRACCKVLLVSCYTTEVNARLVTRQSDDPVD